jgi:hypothetical protein
MPTRSRIPTCVTLAPRSSHRHARQERRFGRGAGPVPPRAPADRRRRSPAWRSPARPSPAAATGAATGSPPGVAAERGSGRPPGRLPARSPGRIASSRDRSGGPVWREVGAIGSRHAPEVPQSPAGGRASRAAAEGRARLSGRQALATAGPARGQDAASARRFHAGAEAVLPGAVALLGLVGLLHRACARSSPSGLGVPSVFDPRRHANAPIARCTGGARSTSGG